MFSKFNLKIDGNPYDSYYSRGEELYNNMKSDLTRNFERVCYELISKKDKIIDGSKLQNEWFPIDSTFDIFLSHSHKDERAAISLAGYLWEKFNLKVFIDSCLWRYADDLLNAVDKIYCTNNTIGVYDYNKRNNSTSHIHMMLSNSLNNMIDETESIFFLNTSNSIELKENMKNYITLSPWIYNELNSANILRIKDLTEYRKNIKKSDNVIFHNSFEYSNKLTISYDIDTIIKSFEEISVYDLLNMEILYKKEQQHYGRQIYALDILYIIKNLVKKKERG